jgi:putative spermidine/putrescine transport system substrate-binding protein
VRAADAICYNCPPQWADWASALKAVEADLGLKMPHDNKNSGQALSQVLAERNNPVADMAYYGITFGIKAKARASRRPTSPPSSTRSRPG